MIRPDDIDSLASLSRLRVTASERETLTTDLERILNYVSELTTLTLPPGVTDDPAMRRNVFRDDRALAPNRPTSQGLVAAAAATERGFIKVKKIIGG